MISKLLVTFPPRRVVNSSITRLRPFFTCGFHVSSMVKVSSTISYLRPTVIPTCLLSERRERWLVGSLQEVRDIGQFTRPMLGRR